MVTGLEVVHYLHCAALDKCQCQYLTNIGLGEMGAGKKLEGGEGKGKGGEGRGMEGKLEQLEQ